LPLVRVVALKTVLLTGHGCVHSVLIVLLANLWVVIKWIDWGVYWVPHIWRIVKWLGVLFLCRGPLK
jgi:hypothetical protein